MAERIINICGKDVGFKASALTPRLYRLWIGRDVIRDVDSLVKYIKKFGKEDIDNMSEFDGMGIVENLAWTMARNYDKENVPDNIDEWLEGFDDPTAIIDNIEIFLELWNDNLRTTSNSKKKVEKQ